jgi:serine protease inhibitor
VLTDALYLNATWKHPFNHALTGPGSFATGSGQVTAKYMTGVVFPVRTAAGWTVARLPYRGGRLSMLALLPPAPAAGQRPAAGCQLPTTGTRAALTSELATGNAGEQISIPIVKLSTSASLAKVLTSLGMGVAFGRHADFSGLSPAAGNLGFVQHAATLDMAEKGTVASAATALGVTATALPIRLDFDRPYLLMLRDSLTDEPLMLAWVANPAAS